MVPKRHDVAVCLSRQRVLSYSTRKSLLKWLRPEMLKNFPFESDFFGMKFRGNIVNYIDRLIYFCGAHEKYMLYFMRDVVAMLRRQDPSRTLGFIDVGANAGNHSLYMSKFVEKIYAFEPFRRVRDQLESNIKLNKISNIEVFPFGLGNENTKLPFYAGPDNNLGSASFCRDHRQEENKYLEDLEIRIGDEVVKKQKIGPVQLLKADVEGFERPVLEGFKETLRKHRPLCIIELSAKTRQTIGSSESLTRLFPENYCFYRFAKGDRDSGHYRLTPFTYTVITRIEDVIACPQEWQATLPLSG